MSTPTAHAEPKNEEEAVDILVPGAFLYLPKAKSAVESLSIFAMFTFCSVHSAYFQKLGGKDRFLQGEAIHESSIWVDVTLAYNVRTVQNYQRSTHKQLSAKAMKAMTKFQLEILKPKLSGHIICDLLHS